MNDLKLIENEGLIKVYTTDEDIKVVDGRELWEGLSVKQDFSDWIKSNLKSVDAIENKDYFTIPFKRERQILIEYTLKLEIAKEICLVAGASPRANKELKRNSKNYRKYLIEVEEKYKASNNLTKTQLNQINDIVSNALCEMQAKHDAQIEQFKKESSQYYRPTSKTKYDISSYIKDRLDIPRANEEFDLVKKRTLLILGADKWEDIPKDVLLKSLNIIDESIRIIKSERKTNQISFFEKDNFC
ncbi:TPA: antA/AntB antirepressor family protein [Clostridioides difficile]|uniref:antA/AntB antirepressor family protein n=2 Tax=Clostridioides difficile TaxID=1496 RepID=UPI0009801104|nr:antA/AntB antirepressor family protein [Clostridioides difficile]EKG0872975.1 antA/AntB antirepressor family protein [Clostridioides difficile]MCI9907746.1 antA/AntB antirepressor family protein [Clostridioides difficile]MCJ0523969.1 antA/AntB antirepressor family protein [Clostridioides difficile]MCJ0527871.1 antA/AntB antirepressor family protein [Clostridioides difficile]MCO8871271.1 antA/AntB antirepressor family protein [Clostridioides difficile]